MSNLADQVRKPPVIIGGLVGLAILAFLAFGVFGIQTLFTDDVVNEDNPFTETAGASGRAEDATSADLADKMNDAMTEEGKEGDEKAEEPMPEAMEDTTSVVTVGSGQFEGRSHPAEGLAKIITNGEQTFLRFEEFATDNGPDLKVYLSAAPLDADSGDYDDDFVNLGELKGNIGDQNYEIPVGTDLSQYTTVVIWCERFSVAFGAAALTA